MEGVRVEGNSKTSARLVESLLELPLGEPVHVSALEPIQRRLLSTGYFSRVEARLDRGSERGRVILVVEVEERNTVILSDVILGSSSEHPFWGGLDVVEGNLFGQGLTLGGAFVVGDGQQGYRLQLADPWAFSAPLRLSAEAYYLQGAEGVFADADRVGSVGFERAGGEVGVGFYPLALLGVFLDVGVEWLDVSHRGVPADLGAPEGTSANPTLRVTLDHDTRDDPLVPRSGYRLNFSMQSGAPLWGSDFDYVKMVLRTSLHRGLAFGAVGHVLRFDLFGGIVLGDAPWYERFFIGDVSSLVPGRDLGMSFSTRPGLDLFSRGADRLSYESVMAGGGVEYGVPLMQGPAPFYRVEFFLGVGLYGMTTPDDLPRARRLSLGIAAPADPSSSIFPIDLTFDLGFRAETPIGVFGLSFANGLALVPF